MKEARCLHCGSNEFTEKNGYRYCQYCGSKYIKRPEDQEVLLATAYQELRFMNFVEAENKFEDIIERYPRLPEAYWGCVCAKYGIKFERDVGGKQIPTCCMPVIESFLEDRYFKKATDYSDMETSDWYRRQGEYIERVKKTWLENASKREPYDIFISYKDSDKERGIDRTDDSIDAQELYTHLIKQGYRVFYSRECLRDVIGEKYEPYIFHALNTAKVMIVYGSTPEYINSTWLKNEWQRYHMKMAQGEKKKGSLMVIYNGFSPSELPTLLRSTQALDWNSRSCYQDLDNRLKAFVLNAEEQRRLDDEARRAKAEEERKKKEEAERQRKLEEERKLLEAEKKKAELEAEKARKKLEEQKHKLEMEALAAKKQRQVERDAARKQKRQERIKNKEANSRRISIGICLILFAATIVGAILGISQANHTAPIIVGIAILILYTVFWVLIKCVAKFNYIWLYLISSLIMTILSIYGMTQPGEAQVLAAFAEGGALLTSVILSAIGWRGKSENRGSIFVVSYVFSLVFAILLPIGVSQFFKGLTGVWIRGLGIAGLFIVLSVYLLFVVRSSSVPTRLEKLLGSILGFLYAVIVAAIVFLFISREYTIYSLCIMIGSIVASSLFVVAFSALDDSEHVGYAFSFISIIASTIILLIALAVLFWHWGASDFRIKDGVLKDYFGTEEIVEIPEGVTEIEDKAFSRGRVQKSLREVVVPDSVQIIGSRAFEGCELLLDVKLSEDLRSIGDYAFYGTSLRKVELPSKVTYIGSYAFPETLTSITLPDGLAEIAAYAFYGTSITEIAIPDSVISIGSNCFDGCNSLTTVYLGSGLRKIGNTLFRDTNLHTIIYNGTEDQWENIAKTTWQSFGMTQEWDYEAGYFDLIYSPYDSAPSEAGAVIARPTDKGCASTIDSSSAFILLLTLLSACTLLTRRRRKGEA